MRQFNDREELFNQNKSEYPELDALNAEFKPFYELTTMAYMVEWSLNEWITGQFIKLDSQDIE